MFVATLGGKWRKSVQGIVTVMSSAESQAGEDRRETKKHFSEVEFCAVFLVHTHYDWRRGARCGF